MMPALNLFKNEKAVRVPHTHTPTQFRYKLQHAHSGAVGKVLLVEEGGSVCFGVSSCVS